MSKKNQTRTRNPVGWGYVEEDLSAGERAHLRASMEHLFDSKNLTPRPRPRPQDVGLIPARLAVPASLRTIVSIAHEDRLLRAVGRSFQDLARLRESDKLSAPDAVASPESSEDLERVLAWADSAGLAVIPFGGGSSVVGGINPEGLEERPGVVTVDLQKMKRVLDISERERVVEAEAGILGPDLDLALRPHKFVVRHMPQSYQHSTLGGWVATRGAGHNSTLHTKIEDRVQAIQGMLADGTRFATRPLPATSVAVDPRSYWIGSEGALGFITSVRLRVYSSPLHRAFRALAFPDFESALEATRLIAQSDLYPVQVRVLDPAEYENTMILSGRQGTRQALMILADESAWPVVEDRLRLLTDIAREAGGRVDEEASRVLRDWIRFFFRQPYMRDHLLDWGIVADTFETSIPWSRVPDFYHEVRTATQEAMSRVCGDGRVGCRVTHAYPDGPCLYFSFYGPGRHGSLVSQWRDIRAAGSEAIIAGGGTISHHHAMGRDHKPWARREYPEIHRRAIRALKAELDPKGLMNPGLWFED